MYGSDPIAFFKPHFPYHLHEVSVSTTENWHRTGLQLTTNLDDWDIVDSQPVPGPAEDQPGRVRYPLVELLKEPRQWGFAIVNVAAGDQPTGVLGFDKLLISPFQPRVTIQHVPGGRVRLNVVVEDLPEEEYQRDGVMIILGIDNSTNRSKYSTNTGGSSRANPFAMLTSTAGLTFTPTDPMAFFCVEPW